MALFPCLDTLSLSLSLSLLLPLQFGGQVSRANIMFFSDTFSMTLYLLFTLAMNFGIKELF
ncbi:hypothetical protein LguiA_010839 [Lonicera macranthoides]